MCGICGIFGKSSKSTVRKMLSVLYHRGPDDRFYVTGKNFSLGATRLSIIDVEKGRQPISNEDGDVWVALNGEIYNFPELRTKLAKQHSFKTRCDTEVLVHLYEDEGERFVYTIDGMFAIALWDGKRKMGILVRDRVGKKPLYYTQLDGAVYFASEIKSLLQIPNFKRKINLEALHHYLSYKHVPSPMTIFQGIYQLKPAHYLVYSSERKRIRINRYWKADFSPMKAVKSEKEILDQMERILKKAVKKRLMSDVPIGFFVSGGIDSGLIAAIASKVSPETIKTFTLTYAKHSLTEGKKLDQKYARLISKMYGTEHHEEKIDFSDFPAKFPKIISHFDEPFAGVISTYFLSRLIAKHVKVAISGDGADELFGSYLSHRLAFPIYELRKKRKLEKNPDLEKIKNYLATIMKLKDDEDWKWRYFLLVFTDEEKQKLYSSKFRQKMKKYSTLRHLKRYFKDLQSKDPLNRILEAEFNSFFPDQVLTFVDRLSMAHSLEVRAPYLDPEFINFVAKLPGKLKIRDGETKYILKKLALRYLPKEIVYRKKEGFIMPLNKWLYEKLENYVREILSEKNLKKHGLFNVREVLKLVDEFYRGKKELAVKILVLLSFQIWYELYMCGDKWREYYLGGKKDDNGGYSAT
jgi:asparagine synthase (glutamine-hydrolysing)